MPNSLLNLKKYKKRVKFIKLACISLASIFICLLLFLPIFKPIKQHLLIKSLNSNLSNSKENKIDIAKAEFYSSSEKGEPFKLFAKSAAQTSNSGELMLHNIFASVTTNSNKEVTISAKDATWLQSEKFLRLLGNVEIKADNGYEIKTIEAEFDLKKNIVESSKKVTLDSKVWNLVAQGFKFDKAENILKFEGPVKLNINR